MPKQSESQAIGIDAEKIFEILLSSRLWNIQKIPQECDYGLDHRVENIRNGDLQGSGFLSRIKGFSKIDSNKDISISIKTDTLEYWKEKLLSVLWVAIDCSKKHGFFVWIDKSLEVRKSQQTQTIRIPRQNILEDYKIFISFEPYYKEWAVEAKNKVKQNF